MVKESCRLSHQFNCLSLGQILNCLWRLLMSERCWRPVFECTSAINCSIFYRSRSQPCFKVFLNLLRLLILQLYGMLQCVYKDQPCDFLSQPSAYLQRNSLLGKVKCFSTSGCLIAKTYLWWIWMLESTNCILSPQTCLYIEYNNLKSLSNPSK